MAASREPQEGGIVAIYDILFHGILAQLTVQRADFLTLAAAMPFGDLIVDDALDLICPHIPHFGSGQRRQKRPG